MPFVPSVAYPRFLSQIKSEWTFVRNTRGTPQLYYFGYIYRIDKVGVLKNKNIKYFSWRCVSHRRCECKGRMMFRGNKLCKEIPHTNHPKYHIESDQDIEYKSFEDTDIDEWLKGLAAGASL